MSNVPELFAPAVSAGSMSRDPQPILAVNELILRPWRPADAQAVVDAYRDPAIRRWHGRSMTEDEAQEWVASWAGRWAAEPGAGWAITQDDTPLGRMDLRRLDLAEGGGEAAYWVLPSARGRGLAPRALRAVTVWAFDLLACSVSSWAFHCERGLVSRRE